MTNKRNPILCTLVFLLSLGFYSSSAAQTGASVPFFEIDTLHIPRIDVEGFGSLRISLLLLDESTLTFSVSEAIAADQSLTPGATIDLATTILDIPLVKANGNFYAVQMQLLPGDQFQITVADDTFLPGQTAYQEQCQTCHGDAGQGGAGGTSLINCSNCGDLDVLSSFINNMMPLGNVANCVDECAIEVADYILNVF